MPTVAIKLIPLGKTLHVEEGTPLQDVLFDYGVEFPCGGMGKCKGCRVKVLEGELPVTEGQENLFTPQQLEEGWRLACQYRADRDLTLEIGQFETPILADETRFDYTPVDAYGIAIDLGTTTIVGQLVDCRTGRIAAVESCLNPQAQFGADIMSRIEYALKDNQRAQLRHLIREQIYALMHNLLRETAQDAPLQNICICGNTAMHHFFCDIDTTPLSQYPFTTDRLGQMTYKADELGWDLPDNPAITFLPNLGGFVGSDLLAGILATRMHERENPIALVDLGTNGEIVIGNKDKILCASTAAGPAFEGGRVSIGMRASTGAISSAKIYDGALQCHVIGHGEPRGICGSGLVDVVACAMELEWIKSNGAFAGEMEQLVLSPKIALSQRDIRELQLAKAAIAAGIQIILNQLQLAADDVEHFYLAGAFGNYLNPLNARWIGLFPFSVQKVVSAGNTALLGTKMALLNPALCEEEFHSVLQNLDHFCLSSDAGFHNVFIDQMVF